MNNRCDTIILGISTLEIPTEICEGCVQVKQHKGKCSKDADRRTNNHLEVVYLDVCGPMQVDFIGDNRYFVTFIYDIVECYGHT